MEVDCREKPYIMGLQIRRGKGGREEIYKNAENLRGKSVRTVGEGKYAKEGKIQFWGKFSSNFIVRIKKDNSRRPIEPCIGSGYTMPCRFYPDPTLQEKNPGPDPTFKLIEYTLYFIISTQKSR